MNQSFISRATKYIWIWVSTIIVMGVLVGVPTVFLHSCAADNAFRPVVENRTVVIEAGMPVQLLGNKDKPNEKIIVHAQELASGVIVDQDISGWVAMPPSHWRQIKSELEAYNKLVNKAPLPLIPEVKK